MAMTREEQLERALACAVHVMLGSLTFGSGERITRGTEVIRQVMHVLGEDRYHAIIGDADDVDAEE